MINHRRESEKSPSPQVKAIHISRCTELERPHEWISKSLQNF